MYKNTEDSLADEFFAGNMPSDITTQIAREMFDVDEPTPEQRREAKNVVFKEQYGMGPGAFIEAMNAPIPAPEGCIQPQIFRTDSRICSVSPDCTACTKRPHWTKKKPTGPGWYKTIVDGEFYFVEVYASPDGTLLTDGLYLFEYAEGWWWSEPEELPELPGE